MVNAFGRRVEAEKDGNDGDNQIEQCVHGINTDVDCADCPDSNMRIEQGADNGLVITLSNYGAWALVRRLRSESQDTVESNWTDNAIIDIENALR